DPGIGRSTVTYARLAGTPRSGVGPTFTVRGALVSADSAAPKADSDLPEITADLAGLMSTGTDDKGRPIVGLPRYGDAVMAEPETRGWGAQVNKEPDVRAVAGLG